MRGTYRIAQLSLFALLVTAGPASLGQANRGSLNGTVKDATGRPLAGARITALQETTGLQREAVSAHDGTYTVPDLPIGLYRVASTAAGFQKQVFERVEETVGHTRTLDIQMAVTGGTEQVKVSATESVVDKNSAAMAANSDPRQVKELPLNGRNWSTLTALVPGAVDSGGSNQRSIRFAGRGLDDNNFTWDGIDATNIVNQAQQPFVRLAIPLDAIQEFRVDTMIFTAENGSTPGGQIAVASRSGSNQLHWSVFEFLRNDVFDAREPIDKLNPTKPAFRLNQFGGSLGGALVRDHSFFFINYEGLRQNLGQTLPGFVPSDAFRATVAARSPALVPVLNAYPHGSLAVADNADIMESIQLGHQIDDENSAMIRLDHRFSNIDTAYLRFGLDAAKYQAPMAGGGTYLNDKQMITSRPVNGELDYLHVFSSRLINEAKFGFNRGNVYTTNQSVLDLPVAVAVSGLTTLSSNQFKLGVGNSFSWIDNVTIVRGDHTIKTGVEVRRIQLNQGNTSNGSVGFSSLNSFASNSVSSASYALALPVNGLRKAHVYSYAEDEWKFRPNVTLNLGLRYSFFGLFHEVRGRAVPFDFATCGAQGFCGVGSSFGHPNILDIDPRISFTWAPASLRDRTLIRTGFGLYHGDGQLDDQNLPINNEVGQYSLSVKTTPNLTFPIIPFLNGPGTVSARDDDRRRKDSYVTEWGISIQQSLAYNLVSTTSYAGSKGTYLLSTSYVNLIDPETGTRPYKDFGQVQWRGNTNSSSYESFVETLQRTFARGLVFNANYVWSHEIDEDAAGGGDSDYPQNPACFVCERASGDFDARHVFTANLVYDLPFLSHLGANVPAGTRIVKTLLGSWSIAPVFTARSGLPVNVTEDRSTKAVATGYATNQRPNRVAGVSLISPGGSTRNEWINPAAFSFVSGPGYGNAGRNIVRGPDLWQADIALSRRVLLTESAALRFRGEFFNLFNRAQYGLPLADLSTSTFGQIVNTVNTGPIGTGTPREMQFSLRLEF